MSTAATTELSSLEEREGFQVSNEAYTFSWRKADDIITLSDPLGRVVATMPMQPAVTVVHRGGDSERSIPGAVQRVEADASSIAVTYTGVNDHGEVRVRWSFSRTHITQHPVEYFSSVEENVVSVTSFAQWERGVVFPGLKSDFIVQPGTVSNGAISPFIRTSNHLSFSSWLGRGSESAGEPDGSLKQQWGLPVHYFGGLTIQGRVTDKSALTTGRSHAFCAGAADLPVGDMLIVHKGGYVSPVLRLNGHLWDAWSTAEGALTLGPETIWVLSETPRDAISLYYSTLVELGRVSTPPNSSRKSAVLGMSQFNTWGAQVAEQKAAGNFDQASLELIHADLAESGMTADMFVIDDKWEGEYGLLAHDTARFPQFQSFLRNVREGGQAVGMWAAFLRCDRPESHGLTAADMLCDPTGSPIQLHNMEGSYFLFDASIPRVQEVLAENARTFMRTYRPDLVKFDFGYELPSLAVTCPRDRSWAGEVMLRNALSVIVNALREVNPDVAVMYYNLSPLFTDLIDQHSTDDLWENIGEYDAEASRRLYFSSVLGELGVPSYGSGGYDWTSMRDIWFDTIASGPVGSLGSFRGDQSDSELLPVDVAKYRGLSRLSRRNGQPFRVVPLSANQLPGSTTARPASWARFEQDAPVLVALRPHQTTRAESLWLANYLIATASVVVASLTDDDVACTEALGVVPFGDGEVRIKRVGPAEFSTIVHRADGSSHAGFVVTEADDLIIRFAEFDHDQVPIDWYEVSTI